MEFVLFSDFMRFYFLVKGDILNVYISVKF